MFGMFAILLSLAAHDMAVEDSKRRRSQPRSTYYDPPEPRPEPAKPAYTQNYISHDQSYESLAYIASSSTSEPEELIEIAQYCLKAEHERLYCSEARSALACRVIQNPNTVAEVPRLLREMDDWSVRSAIAACPKADEDTLIAVAKHCVRNHWTMDDFKNQTVASFIRNPNVTDKVLSTLLYADQHPEALRLIAVNPYSSAAILTQVGQITAKIKVDDKWHIEKAMSIAHAIMHHQNVTDEALRALVASEFGDVWKVVASSPRISSDVLTSIAHQCAAIGYSERLARQIADALIANPSSTTDTFRALKRSRYHSIVRLAADAMPNRATPRTA